MSGRVHFSRVSPSIDYKDNFDPADAMQKIASSSDLRRTARQLQSAARRLQGAQGEVCRDAPSEGGGWNAARIPGGQVLKYSREKNSRELFMLDPRVPQLRERLGLPAARRHALRPHAGRRCRASSRKSNGLTANGQLTAATVDALNGPSRDQQTAAIIATMERWRWMPRDLGAHARRAQHPGLPAQGDEQRRSRSGRPASWSASRRRPRRCSPRR